MEELDNMFPKKIKIGGFSWNIVMNENLMHERNEIGCMRPKRQQIDIDSSATIQQQQETFIHELLEAVISQYTIKLEHDDLSNIATVLHQIIIDNPNILTFKEVND